MKHYKTASNCYKDYIPVKGYYKSIRDAREDFEDLFTAECDFRRSCGDLSVVFCLTYNDEHIRNFYGRNVLDSDDLHKRISKASRFGKWLKRHGYEFDYIVVGEYGNGGASHNYVGVRGSGNNPHYHGVGFFHKFDPDMPNVSYDLLCEKLREAWQGCAEVDPSVYGRSNHLRSLGLGFVKLQGEIICPTAGVQYISKYIGKDIMLLHKDMLQEVLPSAFKQVAFAAIIEWFGNKNLGDMSVVSRLYNHWQMFLPVNHPLYVATVRDKLICPSDMYYPVVPFVQEILDNLYHDFIDDFTADLNRISPKLRHFHGFGYSLLEKADLENGTYIRPLSTSRRQLPLCLIRKAYYDYSVSLIQNDDPRRQSRYFNQLGAKTEVSQRYAKQVSYTLNDLGRKRLTRSLQKRISIGVMTVRSNNMDICPVAVALVHTFMHTQLTQEVRDAVYDILDSHKDANTQISNLCELYLSIVNFSAPDWYRELNTSILYPFNKLLRDFPKLMIECLQYFDYLKQTQKALDEKATDFVVSSHKIYISTY